jgi:hypothetical protein
LKVERRQAMKQKTALEYPKSDKFKEAISWAVKRALSELKGKANRAISKESKERTMKHVKEKDFFSSDVERALSRGPRITKQLEDLRTKLATIRVAQNELTRKEFSTHRKEAILRGSLKFIDKVYPQTRAQLEEFQSEAFQDELKEIHCLAAKRQAALAEYRRDIKQAIHKFMN